MPSVGGILRHENPLRRTYVPAEGIFVGYTVIYF